MARNLFEEKKLGTMNEEVFDEYVKESDKIGKKRNESNLQKHLKGFLKGELKNIVDNFVKANNINDEQLDQKAKAFFEIFHIKFSKIFSVIFKIHKQDFLDLLRTTSKTSNAANTLWIDVSTKYQYFKTHRVMNSDLLKGFVRNFLSCQLIQKEIQFFMMYHFDLIHDFDISKFMNGLGNVAFGSVDHELVDKSNATELKNGEAYSNLFTQEHGDGLDGLSNDNKKSAQVVYKNETESNNSNDAQFFSDFGVGKIGKNSSIASKPVNFDF